MSEKINYTIQNGKDNLANRKKYGCPACGSFNTVRKGVYLVIHPRFLCKKCKTLFYYKKDGSKKICLFN